MHVIQSIMVKGLRGRTKPLEINFDDHVNFLIGRNGSGKTTLINLITSVLSIDVVALAEAPFDEIRIRLKQKGSNRRPIIEVQKHGTQGLTYDIFSSSTSKAKHYPIELDRYFGGGPSDWRYQADWRYAAHMQRSWSSPTAVAAKEHLAALVMTTWLSVHRAEQSRPDEGRVDYPVDKRLIHVAREFGSFFSVLDKQVAEETTGFQQTYFLSLVSPPKASELGDFIKQVDVDKEHDIIAAIFGEFKLKPSQYASKLETFRRRVRKAKEDYKPTGSVPADVFLTLTDVMRIHGVTESWNSLLKKRDSIYRPKRNFVDAINDLFLHKTLSVNPGNEPVFSTEDGQALPLMSLSSGEKQMFILLGEALLQRNKACIYMADEPELSLHIDWQLNLVPKLRELNPNAQVIFATHSPDVVGEFRSHTIDLEADR